MSGNIEAGERREHGHIVYGSQEKEACQKLLAAGFRDKVGEDIETGEVKLRRVRNEGGTFSKEWVSLARIAETVAEPDKAGRFFHTTRLKGAWWRGRSGCLV